MISSKYIQHLSLPLNNYIKTLKNVHYAFVRNEKMKYKDKFYEGCNLITHPTLSIFTMPSAIFTGPGEQ